MKRRRYFFDEGFFDAIDGEAEAYWLGFAAADGNVYGTTLTFGLAAVDGAHLDGLVAAVAGNQKSSTRMKVDGHYVCTLKLNSVRMVRALAAHGIVPRKSLTLQWPAIPAEMERHFLRGYIDGDGSWSHRPSRVGRPTWTVSVVGTEPFLRCAMAVLRKGCDLRPVGIIRASAHCAGIDRFSYSGNQQVARIARFLYDAATVYLPRKKALADAAIAEAECTVTGWAAHPEGCADCGRTSGRYYAKGLCRLCYNRRWLTGRA